MKQEQSKQEKAMVDAWEWLARISEPYEYPCLLLIKIEQDDQGLLRLRLMAAASSQDNLALILQGKEQPINPADYMG